MRGDTGRKGGLANLFLSLLIFLYSKPAQRKIKRERKRKCMDAKTGCSHPPFTLPFPPFT
jgi:hypothetical protein